MRRIVERIKREILSWPRMSVRPHRFAAEEFRFNEAEVGHVHRWGDVDIPFPRAMHDALLEHGLAERHRWLPASGWTTFHLRSERDVEHALWLMRLSYLRYALKTAADPQAMLREETERLGLSLRMAGLLARFVPAGPGSAREHALA